MTITEKFYTITGEPKEDEIDNLTYGLQNLTAEQQKQVEELLKDLIGFGKIEWIELPTALTKNSKGEDVTVAAKTRKIDDNGDNHAEFLKGKTCYLYQIVYSPVLYDPSIVNIPVKDGCVFAPTIYNPETFEPTQSITLTWSPDFPQDIDAPERTYEDDKQMIRDMLEKVLANPKEYKPKGKRGLMIRYALDKTEE